MNCRPSLCGALALISLILGSAPAHAQMTPIARLECNVQNYPNCGGWTAMPVNQFHTRRLVEGAGPQGQDVVQFDLIPASFHSQFYMGWQRTVSSLPGTTGYLRIRFRVLTPFNPSGPGDVWTTKFAIVGDPHDSRVIVDLKPVTSDQDLRIMAQKGVGGGPTVPFTLGAWTSLQVGMNSSGITTWVNERNSQFSNPNARNPQSLVPSVWTNVNLGFYSNATISSQGRVGIQIAEAEWDDQFDSNWHQPGSGGTSPPPPPAAPTNVRVIRLSSAAYALPLVGFVIALQRRSRQTDGD